MTQNLKPPKHLQAPEAALWREIRAEYGIDDAGGLAVLTAALEARGRQRRCREVIDRDGELTPEGKPHPLLLCERDSRKAYLAALKQLDLDVEPAGAVGRPTATVRRIK